MAAITTTTNARPTDILVPGIPRTAGEAVLAGQPVYEKTADGRVYKASAAAANNAAVVLGFTATAAAAGARVTVFPIVRMGGYTGVAVGATVFLSDTAGAVQTTAGTVSVKVGFGLSATEILTTCPAGL